MAGGGNFTCGTHEVGLAEEFAGTHAELAAYHLLIQLVVAVDHHAVDACLRPFDHAHLKRYAVAMDALLDGHKVEEEVAVVGIQTGHGIFVFIGALVEHLLVVYIAGVHA